MSARPLVFRLIVALAVCLLASALAGKAWAGWGGSDGSGSFEWDSDDMERVREARQRRLREQAEVYAKALQAVKDEQSQALAGLKKAETKARADAKGDDVKAKRSLRLVRHKGITNLKKVDYKYGRLFTAVVNLKAERGIPDDARSTADGLLVQVKDLTRTNRERIADLYVEVEEPIKALKVLEGIYKSLPANERVSAMDLKARIKALKAQLGIKDDAGAL